MLHLHKLFGQPGRGSEVRDGLREVFAPGPIRVHPPTFLFRILRGLKPFERLSSAAF